MRLDVFFGSHQVAPGDTAGRAVAVIDVLRASTTIAAALANGARAVIPRQLARRVHAIGRRGEDRAHLYNERHGRTHGSAGGA